MKITSKKYKKAISGIMDAIGYKQVAKDVLKSKLKQTKNTVENIILREYAIGKGCKFLTNPITRKKRLNPMRKKYARAVKLIKEAYSRGIKLENEENKK